jgi:SNF2 family DNA or RNA helicase
MYNRFIDHGNLVDHAYQRTGVDWCLAKEAGFHAGFRPCETVQAPALRPAQVPALRPAQGAILADEMGLGKTIVMLAIIALQIKTHKITLVIVPPVLIEQWAKQSTTILGHTPFVFHGAHKKYIDAIPEDTHIVITSYSTMTHPVIANQHWDRIIFDEAHHMRNPKTRNFQSASKLKTSFKWLLTGTPIQNKRKDLYSLFTLMNIPRETYMVEENRHALLHQYMLRRTKESVGLAKNMPPLHYHPETIKWTDPVEKQESERIHELLEFSKVKGAPSHNAPSNDPNANTLANLPPIALLMKAKQMCVMGTCSRVPSRVPPLRAGPSAAGPSAAGPSAENETKSSPNSDPFVAGGRNPHPFVAGHRNTHPKSKMSTVIKRIVKNQDAITKKLVFCHFRNEMDILEEHLMQNNIRTAKIDGRISSQKKRTQILSDTSIEVLILQVRVGCEGLNLQSYSEVYFVSPTWNPFIEDQAIARCHRIGQKKPVNVYRFYMEGFEQEQPTFSQDMYSSQVQEIKKKLEKEIISVSE